MKLREYLAAFMIPVCYALRADPDAGVQEKAFFEMMTFVLLAVAMVGAYAQVPVARRGKVR